MERTIAGGTASSTKVFNIPELVCHIDSYRAKTSDTARLAQVCRQTFQTLVPRFWKNIDGVEILLALILSASFDYLETGELHHVWLPDQLTGNQFARFDLYAPFVNVLNVYSKDKPFFVYGLSLLTLQARVRPLLPNLTSLSIESVDFPDCWHDIPIWINAFSTASVRSVSTCPSYNDWFEHGGPHTATTPDFGSTILGILSDYCPGLETMTLYPRDHYFGTGFQHLPEPSVPWYEYLEDLPELRHVCLGAGWVTYRSLEALGQLPNLESLELHLERRPRSDFSQFDYLDMEGTFTALHRLSIMGVETTDTCDILRIEGLLEHVTDLQITYYILQDNTEEEDDWMLYELVPSIENAPGLKILKFIDHEDGSTTATGNLRHIGIPEILDVMAQLPLDEVHLEMMHLGTGRLNLNLGIIWPNVTVLVMPSQHASLRELSYFAAMPKLRRLHVRVDMTTTCTPRNIPISNHAPLREIESSLGAKLPQNFDIMMHNVRILYQLWPHLCKVTWSVAQRGSDEDQPLFSNLAKSFNRLLVAHKGLNMYQANECQESNKAEKISVLRSICEDYRVVVDTGADPFEGQEPESLRTSSYD